MGMESYNIMLLPRDVNIIRSHEYWKLSGCSDLLESIINENMMKICDCSIKENQYIFKDIIDVQIHCKENYFQGFEIRGCLSCLEEGIKRCYELYDYLDKIIPLNFFVLNQKVNIKSEEELYDTICKYYSEKITFFKRQYGDEELIVSSGKFYSEIKKHKKWYYKIFHHKIF